MEVLMSYLGSVFFIILLAVAQLVVVGIGVLLMSLIKKIINKAKLEIDGQTMTNIMHVISTIVVATNQSMVNQLKQIAPDGKLTEEQQETIFEHVKTLVISSLSAPEIEYIISKYTDLDKGLQVLIEAAVCYNHTSALVSGTIEPLPDTCANSDMSTEE